MQGVFHLVLLACVISAKAFPMEETSTDEKPPEELSTLASTSSDKSSTDISTNSEAIPSTSEGSSTKSTPEMKEISSQSTFSESTQDTTESISSESTSTDGSNASDTLRWMAQHCYNLTHLRNMQGSEDLEQDPSGYHARFLRCMREAGQPNIHPDHHGYRIISYNGIYMSHWMTLLLVVMVLCVLVTAARRIALRSNPIYQWYNGGARRVLVVDTGHQCDVIDANTEAFQGPDLRWQNTNMDSIPTYDEATKQHQLPSYLQAVSLDEDKKYNLDKP